MNDALQVAQRGGAALLGFDFAFGVPAAFGEPEECRDFLSLIAEAEDAFFDPVSAVGDLSRDQPFLSAAPKGSSKWACLARLGLASGSELRHCERRTTYRPDAKCIFWPGRGQVCGATRAGWKEVVHAAMVRPERQSHVIQFWPFDGDLPLLIRPGTVTLAETYPAETYAHLGMTGNAKTVPKWRREQARHLLDALELVGGSYSGKLREDIAAGFGNDSSGEDRFDALVGLLGMARVALGLHRCDAPTADSVRRFEGWILGQPST